MLTCTPEPFRTSRHRPQNLQPLKSVSAIEFEKCITHLRSGQ